MGIYLPSGRAMLIPFWMRAAGVDGLIRQSNATAKHFALSSDTQNNVAGAMKV